MARAIDHDQQRFKQIVRGKVRQNLRKYVTHGEMIGRQGREYVSIPIPNIDRRQYLTGVKLNGEFIVKHGLSLIKGNAMFFDVCRSFSRIPFKFNHKYIVCNVRRKSIEAPNE